jgi:lauroyl/myristoyl acyltransferase
LSWQIRRHRRYTSFGAYSHHQFAKRELNRSFMHFRRFKDLIALPIHRLAKGPRFLVRTTLRVFGAAARAAYAVPGSPIRQTMQNFCRVTGRTDPWSIYSGMVSRLQQAGLHYASLNHGGREDLIAETIIDPSVTAAYQHWNRAKGGLIFLVPHCAGAVLSSAGLSAAFPVVVLVREPLSPKRRETMLLYLHALGPEYILSRHAPPASVMRSIIRALHHDKVIVGTTDTISPAPDSVETWAFGQRIYSPSWPARIAARLEIPILSGFIRLEGRKIRLLADEGYVESDIEKSTQRWVSNFEASFRRCPSDWVFMLDKRWARVLAAAARDASHGSLQMAGVDSRPASG